MSFGQSCETAVKSSYLKSAEEHCVKNVHRFKCKLPVTFCISMIAEFSRQTFEKYFRNFSQNPFQIKQIGFMLTHRRTN